MIGRTISHYLITERLGAGGMGEIYRAQDTRLNRTVAVKVLAAGLAGEGERRRRFIQEAQAASALNHPNIITIYDIVSEGDTEFLVMEFVAGKTLGELIPAGGLPMPLVLAYAVQIADALEAAHGAGIVHRDLKPANVMVADATVSGQSTDGRPGLVKLLDFGLAKWSAPTSAGLPSDETATLARAPLTVEGSILGTLSYMSPEQAEGKPVDARSDIFAFGAILYEMVTGERAFGGDSAISTLSSILRDEVRPLNQVTSGVPPALEVIVRRCLRKAREERYQTIAEARAALAMLKRDSDSGMLFVRPAPVPPVPVRRKSRLPLLLAAIVLAVLAGCVATFELVAWAIFGHKSQPRSVSVATGSKRAGSGAAVSSSGDAAKTDGVLTNADILQMVGAEVSTKLIVAHIRASKTRFDLSTSAIIALSAADVPEAVIQTMRASTQAAAAQAAPQPKVSAAPSTPPAVTPSAPPADTPSAPPVAPAPAPVVPETRNVNVMDRLPIPIRLSDDVPADAAAGTPVHFAVLKDFHMRGAVVVAEGAVVTGEIVEPARKKLLGGNRVIFRLKDVETTGGGKLALRASPGRNSDDGRRALEPIGAPRRSKDLAAAAGGVYLAYVDGDQTVSARK